MSTVVGYSYMPLSALLSRFVFSRYYSALEWLALFLITLAACLFALLDTATDGDDDALSKLPIMGIIMVLCSVAFSCIGSLLAEKILKFGRLPFYTQKVHLEVGTLATAIVMLFVVGEVSNRDVDAFWKPRKVHNSPITSGPWVCWNVPVVWCLLVATVQSWLGGLVSKRLSTVVRAVAQSSALLFVWIGGEIIMEHKNFDIGVGMSSLVLIMSVLLFSQAGNQRKKLEDAAEERAAAKAEDVQEEVEEAYRVAGASGSSSSCNGMYRRIGEHNAYPKFRNNDRAVLYYESGTWRVSNSEDLSNWVYENPSSERAPPLHDGGARNGAEGQLLLQIVSLRVPR
jgi:hypothetical protein